MMKGRQRAPSGDAVRTNNSDLEAQVDDIHNRVLGGIDPRDHTKTQSLDRHLKGRNNAFFKLLSVFKATSDHSNKGAMGKVRSSDGSMSAQASGRRRLRRVVRDEEAPPPEVADTNPHTKVMYTQEYLRTYYSQKTTASDEDITLVKPYSTCGHTILKKSSGDHISPAGESPNANTKHATFFSEVEIIEFGTQDGHRLSTHTEPLRDSLEEMCNELSGRVSPVRFATEEELKDEEDELDKSNCDKNEVFNAVIKSDSGSEPDTKRADSSSEFDTKRAISSCQSEAKAAFFLNQSDTANKPNTSTTCDANRANTSSNSVDNRQADTANDFSTSNDSNNAALIQNILSPIRSDGMASTKKPNRFQHFQIAVGL